MVLLRQWLLICVVLILGGGNLFAASARETRDYAAAAGAFSDGMYDRADAEFAQFITKYPKSSSVAEAVLLRAQAELKEAKIADAIALLTDTNNLAGAGKRADEYVYWTGEAQFQQTNYPAAAETWLGLPQKFPESKLHLQAVVEAASAFAKYRAWPDTVNLLGQADGVFQRAARTQSTNELVVRGDLLLATAKLNLKDFNGASAILQPLLETKSLKPDLGRECALLLYRVKIAAGDTEAALPVTTNLIEIARLATNSDWTAEGVSLQAAALEKLGRLTDAISAYQKNLTNVPAEWQREAVLKIAALAIAENQFSVATNALEEFLTRFPDSSSADIAQLTLAEVQLKAYDASRDAPTATNQLSEAQSNLDRFISTYAASQFLGKAYLDRGWCFWLGAKISESAGDAKTAAQKFAGSFDDFKVAAQKLAATPPTDGLLVAWFKMGDARFAQADFAGALEDYHAVLASLKRFPATGEELSGPVLYQSLRASLEMKDLAGASDAFVEIAAKFPSGELAQHSSLLYGESMVSPAEARMLLEKLAAQATASPLQPQIGLAVARAYEREQNWPAAITNYVGWLNRYPTNELSAQAGYSLAQAYFRSGDETNAFVQFTNFVAQFPANELAPLAQWWVADHFFRAGDFENAERNYKPIFQNPAWQSSPAANRTNDLFYPAQLMAGRAAVARLDYNGAIRDYFKNIEQDTNCSIELRVQATFAHGEALMNSADSAGTNNPLANFGLAITNEFNQIIQLNPTNEPAALAWFYIGNCYLQLTNYDGATNAYEQVLNSPAAGISGRSRAQIALGVALEKLAALPGADRTNLLKQALNNYLFVFNGLNLRDDEQADAFWLNKAGLQAALLIGLLNDPEVEDKFYLRLETKLPQLAPGIEKKRAALALKKF